MEAITWDTDKDFGEAVPGLSALACAQGVRGKRSYAVATSLIEAKLLGAALASSGLPAWLHATSDGACGPTGQRPPEHRGAGMLWQEGQL